ncbi:MAG: ParB/RepB/Spo0J family partition protein [Candidatus Sericytochromatia bacterium]
MAKNFSAMINSSQEQKRNTNLESENQRLREKIEKLTANLNSIPENNIVKGQSSSKELSLNDIKLYSNIRKTENIESLAESIKEHGQLQPVLLTSDNYLIAGHRRYEALKYLGDQKVLVTYLDKNLEELKDIIDVLQFEENEQRKNLDNFEIAKLFKTYITKGYAQKELSTLFKKSKAYISALVTISEMDERLVDWCKEIQIYAWSKEKFTMVNSNVWDEQSISFYEKNKGNIGWKVLYDISKQSDINAQKKAFLRYFRSRLTESELNDDYFKDVEGKTSTGKTELERAIRHNKLLRQNLKNMALTSDQAKEITFDLDKQLSKVEKLLVKLNSLK